MSKDLNNVYKMLTVCPLVGSGRATTCKQTNQRLNKGAKIISILSCTSVSYVQSTSLLLIYSHLSHILVLYKCLRNSHSHGTHRLISVHVKLKTDRPHPCDYPHMPTNYRHTDKHLRLVMTLIAPNIDRCAPATRP